MHAPGRGKNTETKEASDDKNTNMRKGAGNTEIMEKVN